EDEFQRQGSVRLRRRQHDRSVRRRDVSVPADDHAGRRSDVRALRVSNAAGRDDLVAVTRRMWYQRRLPDGLVVTQTRTEHAEQLEELQRVCFPTLDDEERFKARHYRKHIEIFEDGQFVVLDADRVVGATSTIRLDFDFQHVDHTFADVIEGGWLTS